MQITFIVINTHSWIFENKISDYCKEFYLISIYQKCEFNDENITNKPPIRENTKPVNFPIGLGIIAAVLEKSGHTVEVLDLNALRASNDETIGILKEYKNQFEIIGIGGLITTYKYLKWIIPNLRVIFPENKIVVGGGVVTENPNLILENTPADVSIIGEGEETIVDLLEALGDDGDISAIDGIAFWNNNDEIQINPNRILIKDLDSSPLPAYHLFPMDIYLKN